MEDIILQILKNKKVQKLQIDYWVHNDEANEGDGESCLTKVTMERDYY